MKQTNIDKKEKHIIDGHQFFEMKIPHGIAIIWEDDDVVCMPIIRIEEKYRNKGNAKNLFKKLEKYAEKEGKVFQVSDVPSSIVPMVKILEANGYKKKEFTEDNWGKTDTVAMYRKDGDDIHYDLRTLAKKHLLIYAYFNKEPEEKLDRCWVCLSDLDGKHYICPNCGLCLRCQCISFSDKACHLCNNGMKELRANQVCKRRVVKF